MDDKKKQQKGIQKKKLKMKRKEEWVEMIAKFTLRVVFVYREYYGLWQCHGSHKDARSVRSLFPLSSPLTLGHRWLMWNPISSFTAILEISPESGLELMIL